MVVDDGRQGNRLWSVFYALSSLRKNRLRNTGILLFLGLNIALPSTVLTWSATSTFIVLDDHFSDNTYQLKASTPLQDDYPILQDLSNQQESYEFVEFIDYFCSSVGILTNSTLPGWTWYNDAVPMPNFNVIDFRVIPTSNEIISRMEGEFIWQGSSKLAPNEILISERVQYHMNRTFGVMLSPGMSIGMDVLLNRPTDGRGNPIAITPESTELERFGNLTIAGIYKLKTLSTLAAEAFPTTLRLDPWPRFFLDMEAVLGLADSVMILANTMPESSLTIMSAEGFFRPVSLFKFSPDELIDAGVEKIEESINSVRIRIEEAYPDVELRGTKALSEITLVVETYQRGQMFTLVAFPVILLGIFVTIYTAESSLTERKVEISILRSKGASFNQIISSIMWEANILSICGFIIGILLAIFLVPLIGTSNGLFGAFSSEYLSYISRLRIPSIVWIISVVFCLYLPGLYLYQIEKRIDAKEVGAPFKETVDEKIRESRYSRLLAGFLAVILATLLIPSIPIPFRLGGIEGLLLITLILFIASYLGSRVVQLSVSSLYSKMEQKMGERVLYVIQSLRRRHGKFIPLMIILSLSFTTSIMMLIQSSSFEATMHADVTYSYGADIRLECYIPYQLEFAEELEDYEGIDSAMPVMSRIVSVESDRVFLKGIVPSKYSKIGTFGASTFPHSTPSDALNALESNFNGVIVSEEYSKYLNKTIGDTIRVRVANYLPYDLLIVDTMRSAPGFGYAHPLESKEDSIALNLGYQVSQDGFMLVNIEFLTHIFGESAASLFFISADLDTGFSDLCDTLLASYDVRVDTPHWDLIPERERLIYVDEQVFFSRQNPIYFEVKRFVSGLQGITLIGSLVCILMAIASIGLFFGAAIEERKPEYAIMRAVGATHYQIYTMVFSEFAGLVISAMILSFGMGAIFGYASTSLVLSISPFSPILPEIVSIPALLTFIVIAGEFTVLLAACYYPAKKAGSVSMAMELRNL